MRLAGKVMRSALNLILGVRKNCPYRDGKKRGKNDVFCYPSLEFHSLNVVHMTCWVVAVFKELGSEMYRPLAGVLHLEYKDGW